MLSLIGGLLILVLPMSSVMAANDRTVPEALGPGSGVLYEAMAADSQTVPEKGLRLTLLHINDHHSHLDESFLTLNLQTANGLRERISLPVGGFARMVSAVAELAASHPNVIKIHAGDALSGDLYYTLTQGKSDADLMNLVCFDSLTVGNHEFDNGDAGLLRFLRYLYDDSCQTAILSANVVFSPSSPLYTAEHERPWVQPSVVMERDGHAVGLIGITAAYKTQNASRPDPGTVLQSELQAAQKEIDRLRQMGVRIIVVQSHQGYHNDIKMAQQLRGISAIVGGDSHSFLGPEQAREYGLEPGGDYPTVIQDPDGKEVCIAQAGHYAYFIGQLTLSFDADGNLDSCSGGAYLLAGQPFVRSQKTGAELTEADKAAILADMDNSGFIHLIDPDKRALERLAPYQKEKLSFGDKVVALAETALCSRRVPGPHFDLAQTVLGDRCNNDPHVQAHGGDIQQWVAEVYLREARKYFDVDVSLINGGGVRTDLVPGPVTVKDVYTILPFKNRLVQLKINGATLKAALESAVDKVVGLRTGSGAFPYAAGLRWVLDVNQPKGERLQKMEVRDSEGRYHPFDTNAEYAVATISFLADGKDNYLELASVQGDNRIDAGLEYAQVFLDYLLAQPEAERILNRLPSADYSTQEFIDVR